MLKTQSKMKKYSLILLCLLVLTNCKNDQKTEKSDEKSEAKEKLTTDFEVHREKLTPDNLEICKSKECPKVKVEYLKLKTTTDFGTAFNTENTKDLVSILNTAEDEATAKSVKEAVNNFIKEYLNFRDEFPETEAGYEADISQEILNRSEDLVVLKTEFYLFTGGAHGYGGTHFINFETETGHLKTKRNIISDITSFKKYAEKKFRKKNAIEPDADINAEGYFFENGEFSLPENMAFLPKKVILLYNPYEAASYADGEIRLEIKKKNVEQWLDY